MMSLFGVCDRKRTKGKRRQRNQQAQEIPNYVFYLHLSKPEKNIKFVVETISIPIAKITQKVNRFNNDAFLPVVSWKNSLLKLYWLQSQH